MAPPIVILGPQRPTPNLRAALTAHDFRGPFVVVTAGWRHDEQDVGALERHIGQTVNILPLYAWFEDMATSAPEVMAAYKARQVRIQALQELYRLRLHAAVSVVRELWTRLPAAPDVVGPELDRAVQAVRRVDDECLEAIETIRFSVPEVQKRFDNPEVARLRDLAASAIDKAGTVLIAGGHVAVLRNRLLFFGVEHALARAEPPIVAWGAGAMVLTERIVVYYDNPPEGPTDPEVLQPGLGLLPGVTLFPHAHLRLALDDQDRVAALARRFGPAPCVGLEKGAWLSVHNGELVSRGAEGTAFNLTTAGTLAPLANA